MSLPKESPPPLVFSAHNTNDGQRIACSYQKTQASEPAPTLIWVHGAFEHRQRYHLLMKEFADWGFQSIALDLRGHGESSGTHVYIKHFSDYLTDLQTVYNAFADRMLGHVYLVGHSMGALVAIRFLEEGGRSLPIAGAAFSAPFLGLHTDPPAWKKLLSKAVVSLLPRMFIDNGLKGDILTHDPVQADIHLNDPLIRRTATPRWFEEVLKSQTFAVKNAERIQVPLLILLAGDDLLADNQQARLFSKRLDPRTPRTVLDFPGLYHELFNELDREQPIAALNGWLNEQR